MRTINTENMVKVNHNGKEIAFGKCRKNQYGEYVIKVYENGVFSEDMTIYELTKEDAEASRDAVIEMWSKAEQKAEVEDEPVAESITLTIKEKMVMDKILKSSNFNGCEIDLDKRWEEQNLEGCTYWAFADVRDYGCGMAKQAVRGIFGSLVKKGLIQMCDDEDVDWIAIDEADFRNILKAYGKVGR